MAYSAHTPSVGEVGLILVRQLLALALALAIEPDQIVCLSTPVSLAIRLGYVSTPGWLRPISLRANVVKGRDLCRFDRE